MTPESSGSFLNQDRESILKTISALQKETPEDNESLNQLWLLLDNLTDRALELGASILEIEAAILEGMQPEQRADRLAVLVDENTLSEDRGEEPAIDPMDLETLIARYGKSA